MLARGGFLIACLGQMAGMAHVLDGYSVPLPQAASLGGELDSEEGGRQLVVGPQAAVAESVASQGAGA